MALTKPNSLQFPSSEPNLVQKLVSKPILKEFSLRKPNNGLSETNQLHLVSIYPSTKNLDCVTSVEKSMKCQDYRPIVGLKVVLIDGPIVVPNFSTNFDVIKISNVDYSELEYNF